MNLYTFERPRYVVLSTMAALCRLLNRRMDYECWFVELVAHAALGTGERDN